MKHYSCFLNYLAEIQKHSEYYEDFKKSAMLAKIIEKIVATPGIPFAFFIWYYNEGFTYYEDYFRNFGFVGDNPSIEYHFNEKDFTLIGKKIEEKYSETGTWSNLDDIEVTLNVDIVSLFTSEVHKIKIIFLDLWENEIDKKKFGRIISSHIKNLTNKLQLTKLLSSDCSPELKYYGLKTHRFKEVD